MSKISIYTVDDTPIGSGGMGTVYRGQDDFGHEVAIKEMRAELVHDADLQKRFIQEVNILSNLNHPNIVGMFGSFNINNNLYLVMDFVQGITVEKYVSTYGPLEEEKAVKYMKQVLSGLQYVHEHGIVHRDIKPSNIMLKDDKAMLLDFGIAKDMNGPGLTVGQFVLGTDGYMSPEQAEGYNIDQRSDIYSLGCVLYFMLVGKHAIQTRGNDHETRMAVIDSTFPRAKDLRPDLSDFIQSILDRATNKNMLRRFQSCREFAMELDHSGGTYVEDSSIEGNMITIGREGCDITIYDPEHKVSRRHATIKRVVSSESDYYEYTDCSSNGSIMDGRLIRNDSVSIRYYSHGKLCPLPKIYLANEKHLLDWKEIEAKLDMTKPVVPSLKPEKSFSDSSDVKVVSQVNSDPSDKLGFGWGLLALLVPIVGWVLYYQWKNIQPHKAKSICLVAWIGFVINLILLFAK